MSEPVVLDASAVLAVVQGEAGADKVEKVLAAATVPAANWAEVLQKIHRAGRDADLAAATLKGMGVHIETIDEGDAVAAASLIKANPTLSLGDRFCLAVAERLERQVYTTDRAWTKATTGAKVTLIR